MQKQEWRWLEEDQRSAGRCSQKTGKLAPGVLAAFLEATVNFLVRFGPQAAEGMGVEAGWRFGAGTRSPAVAP